MDQLDDKLPAKRGWLRAAISQVLKPLVKQQELVTVQTGKVPKGQQSDAGFNKQSKPDTNTAYPRPTGKAVIRDVASTLRQASTNHAAVQAALYSSSDVGAAANAYNRLGIPEAYTIVARNIDGTINREATKLANSLADQWSKMPDFANGFSQINSLRSTSEALGLEIMQTGAAALELVLDKNYLPMKLVPVSVPSIKFYPEAGGKTLKPRQAQTNVEVDLDIPTFFWVSLDQNLREVYSHSPFEPGLQEILADAQFSQDMRRISRRSVHPRLQVTLDREKLERTIPMNIATDPEKVADYFNTLVAGIENAINGLNPEDALVHYDFMKVSYVEGGVADNAQSFATLKDILNEKVSTGVKTLPSVLGHGAGSQNVASVETLIFMLSADGIVRQKLNEIYSKAFTLAVRLFGLDVLVDFKYDDIELRPKTELEAFRTMRQSRVLELLSLGFLTDDEAGLELTHRITPEGFKPLSGTGFFKGGTPVNNNPLGNQQGALQQDLKPTTPTQPKGKQ